jgi:hypothetical protein
MHTRVTTVASLPHASGPVLGRRGPDAGEADRAQTRTPRVLVRLFGVGLRTLPRHGPCSRPKPAHTVVIALAPQGEPTSREELRRLATWVSHHRDGTPAARDGRRPCPGHEGQGRVGKLQPWLFRRSDGEGVSPSGQVRLATRADRSWCRPAGSG